MNAAMFDAVSAVASSGQPVPAVAEERFISFRLGNDHFAIPSADVAEVAHHQPVTPLPGMPGWLFGLVNLRGELVVAINLGSVFGFEASGQGSAARLVVLKSVDSNPPLAFPVNAAADVFTAAAGSVGPAGHPFIGTVQRLGESVKLIDAGSIISLLHAL